MSENLLRTACRQRRDMCKKRPQHTEFVCRFGDTPNLTHYLHIIMPPRRKNSRSGASARKRTTTGKEKMATVAAAAAATLAEADAAMAASADEATSTKSTKNPSVGCVTAAAARMGIPPIVEIPTPNLPNNSAKPPDFNEGKFVGSCDYHVSGTYACSYLPLPLKNCGDGLCRIKVHHLCQLDWEGRNGFKETTILRCQLHHPRNRSLTFQVPTLPPLLPNSIPAATGMEFEEIESIPPFQHEGNDSEYTGGGIMVWMMLMELMCLCWVHLAVFTSVIKLHYG